MSSTEKLSLAMGRYAVCVRGVPSLLKQLPLRAYLSETPPAAYDAVINAEDGLSPSFLRGADGWSSRRDGEETTAVYVYHEGAAYAVRYRLSSPEVTVRSRSLAGAYLRLGVQYGILLALSSSCLGLHAVTVQCAGETVLLSAPSGTGKTTLSRLLETCGGARVINGDFAMLSLQDDGVWFEPTPFCGTSGICLNERVRIDRIVFLRQGEAELWQPLSTREALVNVSGNAFIPHWDVALQLNVRTLIAGILPHVKTVSFAFTPTRTAAEVFLEELSKDRPQQSENPPG